MTEPQQPATPHRPGDGEEPERQGPIIRDKRRLDPETGAVREPRRSPGEPESSSSGTPWQPPAGQPPVGQPAPGAGEPADPGAVVAVEQQLAERTADLQRLQAEYTNYRRRVERDREAIRELAVVAVLTNLLPVLDDIGRAREHDELEGGFKSVAEALEQTVDKLGLERFGEPGDTFDPTIHEALTHAHSDDVTEPTAVQIFQPGYRLGNRVVRPARVGVAEPQSPTQ